MVSGRRPSLLSIGNDANGNGSNGTGRYKDDVDDAPNDLEGGGQKKLQHRFRDAVESAIDQRRGAEYKRKITEGVDRDELEKFRKSDEEVSLFYDLARGMQTD